MTTTMKKIETEYLADGFFEKLFAELDAPRRVALSALAKSLRTIRDDANLSEADRELTKAESITEFVKYCIDNGIAELPQTEFANIVIKSVGGRRKQSVLQSQKDERERRAASARANLKHPYDPPEEEEKPVNKQDAYQAMQDLARKQCRPGETVAKAYSRLLVSDPLMKQLYAKSKALPDAVPDAPASRAPNTVMKRVEALQKEDPRLTPAQAMTKVYRELQAAG